MAMVGYQSGTMEIGGNSHLNVSFTCRTLIAVSACYIRINRFFTVILQQATRSKLCASPLLIIIVSFNRKGYTQQRYGDGEEDGDSEGDGDKEVDQRERGDRVRRGQLEIEI